MAATGYHHHHHLSVPSVCPIPRTKLFPPPHALSLHRAVLNPRVRFSTVRPPVVEQTGGKMVVELVGAFNELTERMGELSTSSSARLLFKSLKLSIPLLYPLPFAADGRPPLSRAFSVACLLADLQAKRLKAIMMAAAELAALRLKDMPSTNHRGLTIDHKNRVFRLLDKNGDGRISIEELTEVMEELGAGGEDAQELMRLLDSNSDGSLSTDEFDLFQRQVQFVRNWGDRDDHFRSMLGEKLQMPDSTSLIQVYRKELGDKLAVS